MRFRRRLPVPAEERRAPLVACPICEGRGSWLTGSRPERPGDSQHSSNGGPLFTVCGACKGVGRTSFGSRIGRRGKRSAPGYGCCLRCETPWAFVPSHMTPYTANAGLLPLCEPCWAELTPAERLPFYAQLLDRWEHDGRRLEPGLRERVAAVVMAGRRIEIARRIDGRTHDA